MNKSTKADNNRNRTKNKTLIIIDELSMKKSMMHAMNEMIRKEGIFPDKIVDGVEKYIENLKE